MKGPLEEHYESYCAKLWMTLVQYHQAEEPTDTQIYASLADLINTKKDLFQKIGEFKAAKWRDACLRIVKAIRGFDQPIVGINSAQTLS
jgi:hypothetical protein